MVKTRSDDDPMKKLREKSLRVDMKGRTRGAKNLNGLAAKLKAMDPEKAKKVVEQLRAQASVPRKVGSDKVYSGTGRTFEAKFAADFWASHKSDNCAKCGLKIAPKDRSIDHKKPWAKIKLEADVETVCKDGTHWEVVLESEMRRVYQDSSNLQPMHKNCNSSKNGPKTSDSIAPRKLSETCNGRCGYRKAT